MIPRYRAWSKQERRLIHSEDILAIDYENEEIDVQKIYFEDGLPVERDVYTYGFDNIELMQSTGLVDVAIANCEAEHNGYYYSVGSLVIGDIHFPVVNA